MVPLHETSGDFLAVNANFLIQALEKMAFVLTLYQFFGLLSIVRALSH